MKTVTTKFVSAQKAPDAVFVRQVYYKRRYWNATTRSYGWESSWTQLTEDKIQSVSPIQWQLDTDQLNQFKVSNVTLVLDNSDNRWRLDSRDGFFKQDSASPVYGYEPYWTKFQIKTGFVLADGTSETVAIFTGLATEYTMDSQNKLCQVSVDGLEAQLVNTKAETIATTVTQENVGTGNAILVDFTTLNPGVGGVTLVSSSGITKIEGLDYTVSQLNDATLGAKISFTVAPDVGKVIKATYFYWAQSITFKALVQSLLTAAGIPSLNQNVQDVNFAGGVINTFAYTTQPDWDSGTKTAINSVDTPGAIRIDPKDSSNIQSQTWAASTSGWTSTTPGSSTVTSDGTYLILTTDGAGFSPVTNRNYSQNIGAWSVDFTLSSTSATKQAVISFRSDGSSFGGNLIIIQGSNISLNDGSGTPVGSFTWTADTAEHTLLMTYDGNYLRLYLDGVLKISSLSFSWNPLSLFQLQASGSSFVAKFRNFKTATSTITGTWESPANDFTATPTGWSPMENEDVPGSGTVAYYTKTSANNISYDSYVAISGGIPQSTLRRYVKIEVVLSISSTATISGGQVSEPIVNSTTLIGSTSSNTITLANFTGSDVYEAIQKIGEFTNYEFGFNPDETFFFRPKTTGASVMSMNQSDYLSQVTGMDSGYSRVYGIVRATYGNIVKEITDDGAFASSPLARVTNKRFEISPDSNIQIPATADIATGVASSFYSYLSKQRRRLKARAKFIPQIDLSDVVTVDLVNNSPDTQWFLGDPGVYLGQVGTHLWGEDQQIVKGFLGKVIAARYDTSGRNCEFELEEVV